MSKPLDSVLNWVYKKFSKDASKMLIWTGVAGWTLSSLAQVGAIFCNSKISKEQRSFLLPQEIADAAVNIGSFFLITFFAKKLAQKIFSTGKLAPKSVRAFLDKNKELYSNKVGKSDFDLDKFTEGNGEFPKAAYQAYKSFGTTLVTVGAGVVASNVVTPILRNKMASNAQKKYINANSTHNIYPSSGMKV